MKKIHIILFSIYGVFHLGMVAFTFYANSLLQSNDITKLLNLSKQIPATRWLALFGLLLLITTIMLFMRQQKSFEAKLSKIEAEKNSFKAKMYDMQNTDSVVSDTASEENTASE